MNLVGCTLEFRLASTARRELRGFIPDQQVMRALVVDADGLGAWVRIWGAKRRDSKSRVLTLLRWEYLTGARVLGFPDEPPVERKKFGFRP
jgi:hypothetical protein